MPWPRFDKSTSQIYATSLQNWASLFREFGYRVQFNELINSLTLQTFVVSIRTARFDDKKTWLLFTQCICIISIILKIKSNNFPLSREPVGLCSLWGANRMSVVSIRTARFDDKKKLMLFTQCICIISIIPKIKSNNFPLSREPVGLCSLWVLKSLEMIHRFPPLGLPIRDCEQIPMLWSSNSAFTGNAFQSVGFRRHSHGFLQNSQKHPNAILCYYFGQFLS
jgi:hypothetical protein